MAVLETGGGAANNAGGHTAYEFPSPPFFWPFADDASSTEPTVAAGEEGRSAMRTQLPPPGPGRPPARPLRRPARAMAVVLGCGTAAALSWATAAGAAAAAPAAADRALAPAAGAAPGAAPGSAGRSAAPGSAGRSAAGSAGRSAAAPGAAAGRAGAAGSATAAGLARVWSAPAWSAPAWSAEIQLAAARPAAGAALAAARAVTVRTLRDAGPGSLRAAIRASDAAPPGTATVIRFAVTGTITLRAALPAVTRQVIIDGTTAPGYRAGRAPLVAINASGHPGLRFAAGSNQAKLLGVAVDRASGAGRHPGQGLVGHHQQRLHRAEPGRPRGRQRRPGHRTSAPPRGATSSAATRPGGPEWSAT